MSQENITERVLTLGALLRLPYEALSRRVYARLSESGYPDIRLSHSSVFRHVLPAGSRITALAERAQMTKQSMAYLVESLAAGGYVEIRDDPDDGRAKLVKLTAKGRRVQSALLALSAEAEEECAQLLGREKMRQLRLLLEGWVDLL